MSEDLTGNAETLAHWMCESRHLVVFTGAGNPRIDLFSWSQDKECHGLHELRLAICFAKNLDHAGNCPI